MTAATVTKRLYPNDPTVEIVILTASDGETYVSKKFKTIDGVQATIMQDAATLSLPLSIDISAATATLNCTGLSDLKVCLNVYGQK